MPKQAALSRKRVASSDYESDGGFVEDAPKSKKSKKGETNPPVNLAMQKDDEGNQFWEISRQRRVQVSEFKGATMVGIREFYEKDGKTLPGKKGISLSIDQFTAFLQILPQIDNVLKSRGINVPKPDFTSGDVGGPEEEETIGGNVGENSEAGPPARPKDKSRKSKNRKNHEATSDEDED